MIISTAYLAFISVSLVMTLRILAKGNNNNLIITYFLGNVLFVRSIFLTGNKRVTGNKSQQWGVVLCSSK